MTLIFSHSSDCSCGDKHLSRPHSERDIIENVSFLGGSFHSPRAPVEPNGVIYLFSLFLLAHTHTHESVSTRRRTNFLHDHFNLPSCVQCIVTGWSSSWLAHFFALLRPLAVIRAVTENASSYLCRTFVSPSKSACARSIVFGAWRTTRVATNMNNPWARSNGPI